MKKIFPLLLLISISLFLFSATTFPDTAQKGFKEKFKEKIEQINSPEIKIFLIAMIPIFELRGAIPIGILEYKLSPWEVFPIAIAGNMIPIFLILLFFDFVTKIFFRVPILKKLLEAIFHRTRKKGELIEKYEEIGLMLFVAIPLPVTGAWTGSLAAYLFGLQFWKSILFIFFGVLIAGIVVTTLTLLGWIGAGIAFVGFALLIILPFFRKKNR